MADGQRSSAGSGWTVDTLHQHLDRLLSEFRAHVDSKFADQARTMDVALKAAASAADKAENQDEKWRASANEWRAAMNDRERTFMPRAQAETFFKSIEDRLADLKESRAVISGNRATSNLAWGYVVSALIVGLMAGGFIVGLVTLLSKGQNHP